MLKPFAKWGFGARQGLWSTLESPLVCADCRV